MTHAFPSYEVFQNLSNDQVATLVQQFGLQTCAFPINGTRRWFMLEHAQHLQSDPMQAYLEIAGQNHLHLYRLFFEHGIQTLLTPEFGPDLLERGDEYMQLAAEGLKIFINHPDFLAFYEEFEVQVRFYGDYRQFFGNTPFAYLCDLFDQITQQTQHRTRHQLFIGVCAHDAVQSIATLSVQHHQTSGAIPSKETLIELYYGVPVKPVSLYITFGRPTVFDVPLLSTGSEDLYFTVAPSPYLSQPQLRAILYDHLYSRREPETDYAAMSPEDWRLMSAFYQMNRHHTLGVGALQKTGSYWYPLPQVELPDQFE